MRLVPEALERIAAAAGSRNIDLYMVGGSVRNDLLNLPAHDIDLCGPYSAQDLRSLASGDVCITDPINGLGTALILSMGQPFEYTAFRTDSYAPGGAHTPQHVTFTTDMHVDARRRDFTVNALYRHLVTGEILDPLGTGREDLNAHVLRQVRDDTMSEDALRILRLVRFAAQLGFTADPATLEAAKAHVSGLASITPDRIRDELCRILLSDVPYGRVGAPARALAMLRDIGALDYVLPGIAQGAGFAQNPQYHRYDVLDHQIASCAASPPELATRLAALLHDIAKPEVFARDGNMHRHPPVGAERVKEILKHLNMPSEIIRDTVQLVEEHMFDLNNTAKPRTIRRHILRTGPEQFARLADLRDADFAGSGMGNTAQSAEKWRRILAEMQEKKAPFGISDLAVNGHDIMRELQIAPGPEVGEILRALLEYAADRPARNNYNCLLKYARMLKDGAPDSPGRLYGRTVTEDHKGV